MRLPRRWRAAAVAAGVAAGGAGCLERETESVETQIVGPTLAGHFPGAAATTFHVATDGSATSEAGHDASGGGLRWFPSGVNGQGIMLYTTTQGSRVTLWAHYLCSCGTGTLHPPVALTGANEDPTVAPVLAEACVLFLNTVDPSRRGDALILWRRADLADTAGGTNIRLYYSHFDRILSETPVSSTDPDVRYGFDVSAAAVDLTTATGVDVTTVGLWSDGLHGGTAFLGGPLFASFGFNQSLYVQGDPVSYAGVLFVQASAATPGQPLLLYRVFDLSATNGANLLGTTNTLPLPSGAGASDEVFDYLATTDGSVFFLQVENPGTATQRASLCWNVWGSSAVSGGFLAASLRLNAIDTTNNHQSGVIFPGTFFGRDEGLVNVVGTAKVENVGAAGNRSVFAFQVDPVAGTFSATNDRVELDPDTANTGAQIVTDDSIGAVLDRTGDWLLVRWVQERGTAATQNGRALWARGIQLTRTGTAPALSSRTTGTIAQQIDAITVDTAAAADQIALTGAPASDPVVKNQGDAKYGCEGFQSDRHTTHLIWQQDQTSGTAVDIVRTRRITFTPSTTSANPAALGLGTEDGVTFLDGELANAGSLASPGGFGQVTGLDGGGAGGTAGDLVLYYLRNTGTPTATSFRAFQRRQTGSGTWASLEIGSLNSGSSGASRQCFALVVQPGSPKLDTVAAPDWPGDGHHCLFFEARESDTPLTAATIAVRHRFFDKAATTASIPDRFVPAIAAGVAATAVDPDVTGSAGPLFAYVGRIPMLAITSSGPALELYLSHGGHCWWNRWDPATRRWLTAAGVPAPEIIDHESPNLVTAALVGLPYPGGLRCNDVSRAIVFWRKSAGFGAGERWHVRVRK